MHSLPKSVLLLCAFTLCLLGCKAHTPEPRLLGKPELTLQPASVKELNTRAKQTVTIKGEMVEKCPVAGCWFVLKDKTGTVRVDTKSAGFVVTDVPLHTSLTVTGVVNKGDQTTLKAMGVAY